MVTSVESRHKQDYFQSLHCTSSSLQAHWAWLCFSLVKFITHASIIYWDASTIDESYFSDDGQSNPLNGLLLWIIDLESSETRGHNGPNSWSLLKKKCYQRNLNQENQKADQELHGVKEPQKKWKDGGEEKLSHFRGLVDHSLSLCLTRSEDECIEYRSEKRREKIGRWRTWLDAMEDSATCRFFFKMVPETLQ